MDKHRTCRCLQKCLTGMTCLTWQTDPYLFSPVSSCRCMNFCIKKSSQNWTLRLSSPLNASGRRSCICARLLLHFHDESTMYLMVIWSISFPISLLIAPVSWSVLFSKIYSKTVFAVSASSLQRYVACLQHIRMYMLCITTKHYLAVPYNFALNS